MRLQRLTLENFRQHEQTEIRFRSGLTGIIGPNGAGKSTILEAIAWAIYGSTAARGRNDTIRFSRAPRRSRVDVELVFELGGHEYRVDRTMHDAEVFIDGGAQPIATGLAGATAYLQGRLGMNRDEFFSTYFTGQKELQFLANMGATDRARFLNRLLGYERLRAAQERARTRRTELRHELEGMRSGQIDPAVLEAQITAARERLELTGREHEEATNARIAAGQHLVRVVPRWTEAQKRREAAREAVHEMETAEHELENASRDVERTTRAIDTIDEAIAERSTLEKEIVDLATLTAEDESLDELRRAVERRQLLAASEAALAEEIADTARRIAALEQAPALVKLYGAELDDTRAASERADEAAATSQSEWTSRKQEVTTRLTSYRDRARELKDKIQELRRAGPEGICPTCERPLRDHFESVIARFEDEYYTLEQDGKWLRAREKQLATKPEELITAEATRDHLRNTMREHSERLARCEQAVQELWTLAADRKKKTERIEKLQSEIAVLPVHYDAEQHRTVRQRLEQGRETEKRMAALDSIIRDRIERLTEQADAKKRVTAAKRTITRLARHQEEIGHDEDEFARTRTAHEEATRALHEAELHEVEVSGRVQAAEEARLGAQRELKAWQKVEERARAAERELRHHKELDAAFTMLRQDLNSRVRPELGELASAFLSEITNGRYTTIEIDDAYNIVVLDEGEEKPVISGGEEDVANLVLRLAISQMIAERAGQQLSILILDEVFGSLDVGHRDNVMQLLRHLEGRFEQVILITHIESIREGLDNVLRVEYDERSGSSRVREESASGTPWTPQLVT